MEKVELKVSVEQVKLNAMDFYGGSVQKELQKRVQELYEQTVPEPTREYLDFMAKPQPSRSRAKKPAAIAETVLPPPPPPPPPPPAESPAERQPETMPENRRNEQ